MNNSYTIYKEAMKKGICCVNHKTFRKIFLNTLAEPMRICSSTRTRFLTFYCSVPHEADHTRARISWLNTQYSTIKHGQKALLSKTIQDMDIKSDQRDEGRTERQAEGEEYKQTYTHSLKHTNTLTRAHNETYKHTHTHTEIY